MINPKSTVFALLGLLLGFMMSSCKEEPFKTIPSDPDPILIVGYVAGNGFNSVPPTALVHYTDMIYVGLEPDSLGNLVAGTGVATDLLLLDGFLGTDQRLHVGVGGVGKSDNFAVLADDGARRAQFARQLLQFCQANNLDGVSIDWEFPADPRELENHGLLMDAIRLLFEPEELLLFNSHNPDFEIHPLASEAANFILVKSFDRSGQHATYDQVSADVQSLRSQGVAAEKIILGIPFYGRNTGDATLTSYADIVTTYSPGPDTDEVDNIYFNGVNTVQRKTQLVQNSFLAGVGVIDINQDSYTTSSLLEAIVEELAN